MPPYLIAASDKKLMSVLLAPIPNTTKKHHSCESSELTWKTFTELLNRCRHFLFTDSLIFLSFGSSF